MYSARASTSLRESGPLLCSALFRAADSSAATRRARAETVDHSAACAAAALSSSSYRASSAARATTDADADVVVALIAISRIPAGIGRQQRRLLARLGGIDTHPHPDHGTGEMNGSEDVIQRCSGRVMPVATSAPTRRPSRRRRSCASLPSARFGRTTRRRGALLRACSGLR
jgi:hypothetical protein